MKYITVEMTVRMALDPDAAASDTMPRECDFIEGLEMVPGCTCDPREIHILKFSLTKDDSGDKVS